MSDHLPEHLKATLFGFRQNRDTGSLGADVSRACERKLRAILAAAQAVTSLYSGGAGADINSSTGNSYMDDLLQSLLEALADD